MKRSVQLLGSVGALALALTPTMVAAAGTAAGVDITNTVSVSYQVGGVAQTAIAASDTFKVDRKVDLTVVWQDSSAVTGAPGSTLATTFLVTNTSNKAMDINLTALAAAGGSFTAKNIRVFRETGGNASAYDAGTDTQVTTPIVNVAADAVLRIYVVADMVEAPGTVLPDDAETANVHLVAQAYSGGSPLAQSDLSATNNTGANKTTEETVFADAAGAATGDVAKDGKHSAQGSYLIAGAKLTVNKYSYVVSDPTGNTNPRAIPGAVVEYCIVINNAAGAAQADSVNVSDVVPATLTYSANTIFLNAGFTAGTQRCDGAGGSAGVDGTNYNAGTKTVSNSYGSMAANTTRTLRFRATIN